MAVESEKATILVVDDTHANLHLLTEILMRAGYSVRPVPNGQLALTSIHAALPDLILLDIMMPTMSGYEVCRYLKAEERTRDIPIIFISALNEIFDKVKAFEAGGVDYITKPFQPEEVLMRVATHLNLRRLRHALEARNDELQQEIHRRQTVELALHRMNEELERRVAERTRELQETVDTLRKTQEQLVQSEKMALLISLVAGIAHEINTPVGVGLTAASHLEEVTREFDRRYQSGLLKRSELEAYVKTTAEASQILFKNLQLAAERTQSFKEVAVDQASGEKRWFFLKPYLEDTLLNLRPKLKMTEHHVEILCPENLKIESYPGAFSQIISNLAMNSLIHGFEKKTRGEIRIQVEPQASDIVLTYRDNGKGMTQEQAARVFEAFFTTKREQGGSGLGMNIVYNLVTRKLRGSIECKSIPDAATTFTIRIPHDAAKEET